MKLQVLIDRNTYIDQYLLGEPALSFYIEDAGKKILFDVGYSDAFIQNAKTLGIHLNEISAIVISHGHNDHTLGLQYLKDQYDLSNVEIITLPDAFNEKICDQEPIGAPYDLHTLSTICKLTATKTPLQVSENLLFLGEIPESVESRTAIGQQKESSGFVDDYVLDDSALVYKSPKGLFIITGCSHSGICNIIEYAKQICQDDRIHGIIGGFHLFQVDSKLKNTIQYFLDNQITELYPCHCSSFEVRAEIHKHIPIHEVATGMILKI